LNIKKATGFDGISAKMIKLAKPVVTGPITSLINKSIETSIFPDQLKVVQVKPLFKNKNKQLDKTNYRPASVLPAISKNFERTIFDQRSSFFENHFHPFLSAFRSGYGCQTALLKIIEDWKKALDDNKRVAGMLMDISKAFDCLPHNLLLLKLKTYGLSDSAIGLLFSYLYQRKQCIKVENVCSNFKYMYKGVPQGFILDPVLFKYFINDIFYVVNNSTIYNYADDNTLFYADYDIKNSVQHLESDSLKMLDWFDYNLMKANSDKFQAWQSAKNLSTIK
jgi:hypothetical protein